MFAMPEALRGRLRNRRNRLAWLVIALTLAALAGAGGFVLFQRHSRPPATGRLDCKLPPPDPASAQPGMVWVPAGLLTFGDTVYREEQPVRDTAVAGFWMDRTEVTNDEFAEFVKATGYITAAERELDAASNPDVPPDMRKPGAVVFIMPAALSGGGDINQWWRYTQGANWRHPGGPATDIQGRGTFPVVTMTLEDAQAYARWKGRMLPTESQWEWAARAARPGPAPASEHEQPSQANTWQGLFPVINSADDGFVGLAPVGCYAPNALGLFDLIGNVWELTASAWTPSHAAVFDAPPDMLPAGMRSDKANQHVIKGGSFLCAPSYCMRYRAGARQPQDDGLGASHLGFRTVLAAPAP